MIDVTTHPCFNDAARAQHTRVHLPVAPRCNVQCNFCNRKFDCANETRPGVSSVLLSPAQSIIYLKKMIQNGEQVSVVGIAGPGDPFANANETMETLRLVRKEFPDVVLCIATNGLAVLPYVEELAELKVTHVTITVNAIDPAIGEQIYAWVRDNNKLYRGQEGAILLWERQAAAIQALRRHDIIVKINTIIIPGINDTAIEPVAKAVASLGASIMNCMPLYPVEGAAFADLPAPSVDTMHRVRAEAGKYLPLMAHCMRCRADAAGLLGAASSTTTQSLLEACASLPLDGSDKRTLVAVASREGVLVNEHLGHALRFLIYKKTDSGYECIEERPSPQRGTGDERWNAMLQLLTDCKAIAVEHVGTRPRLVLEKGGLRVVEVSTIIEDALDIAFSGKPVPAHLAGGCTSCGSACKCTGSGEGC